MRRVVCIYFFLLQARRILSFVWVELRFERNILEQSQQQSLNFKTHLTLEFTDAVFTPSDMKKLRIVNMNIQITEPGENLILVFKLNFYLQHQRAAEQILMDNPPVEDLVLFYFFLADYRCYCQQREDYRKAKRTTALEIVRINTIAKAINSLFPGLVGVIPVILQKGLLHLLYPLTKLFKVYLAVSYLRIN